MECTKLNMHINNNQRPYKELVYLEKVWQLLNTYLVNLVPALPGLPGNKSQINCLALMYVFTN